MKAFLILYIIVILLVFGKAQLCNPTCTREMNPHCGVTAECHVPAANLCLLRYKACILDQHHMSPIINVLPGHCPNNWPICPEI
ncbi:accessory gland protein Acp63F [Drosophila kikkawai]|uniref:Accessory gland protein Acp63F n=1 Tax=Drosophila kikkawai TaxID=30033 RepID=A0A6P4IK33_DROKI|nr:accessory gland protein Acp63F [Drosophila kikkawai]